MSKECTRQAPLESPAATIFTGICPMMNHELVVAGTRSMAPPEQRSIAALGEPHLISIKFVVPHSEAARRTASNCVSISGILGSHYITYIL